LCCITFVVWTTVFLIGGVPYAVPLAALGGALEFIPVVGRGVELHPALVIFGVLAGGEIAGVAGMFLSVPVMAAARMIWRRLHAVRAAPVAVARRDTPPDAEERRRIPS
jgi:predicted PurR-regulated permease PerM